MKKERYMITNFFGYISPIYSHSKNNGYTYLMYHARKVTRMADRPVYFSDVRVFVCLPGEQFIARLLVTVDQTR